MRDDACGHRMSQEPEGRRHRMLGKGPAGQLIVVSLSTAIWGFLEYSLCEVVAVAGVVCVCVRAHARVHLWMGTRDCVCGV